MLVLGRKDGERIIVNGGDLVITVVRAKNGSAKIGIEADKEKFTIHREEIQKQIDNTAVQEAIAS